jgi:hypothetical protein
MMSWIPGAYVSGAAAAKPPRELTVTWSRCWAPRPTAEPARVTRLASLHGRRSHELVEQRRVVVDRLSRVESPSA